MHWCLGLQDLEPTEEKEYVSMVNPHNWNRSSIHLGQALLLSVSLPFSISQTLMRE